MNHGLMLCVNQAHVQGLFCTMHLCYIQNFGQMVNSIKVEEGQLLAYCALYGSVP